MKYKEIIRDIAAAGLLVCSFWNILYPEYTFAGDAYQKIEDGTPVAVSYTHLTLPTIA